MGKNQEIILDGLSPNQREAAESTDCDILVRAGAGSGKTKTLVARYLFLLDKNRDWDPADITAVTFTRKAAREMQSRIRSEMMKLAYHPQIDTEDKRFWLEKLNEMDSANIGTIHSLCGRILRAHPAEAGLDPAFSVLDDNNSAMLTAQIIEETISRISSDPDYEPLLNFYDVSKLTQILADMLKSRSKTDEIMSVCGMKTEPYLKIKVKEILNQPTYSEIIEDYREMISESDFDRKAGVLADRIKSLTAAYDKALELIETDCHPADALECIYNVFDGWNFSQGSKQLKANAMLFRNELLLEFSFLKKDTKNPNRNIAWYKEFWTQYDGAEECLRHLWPEVRNEYMHYLDSAQAIDFDAMESLTLDLLKSHQDIREKWTNRIKALLVDEFQDTNDTQTELFSLLNPFHNRLFAVGDKKQSIYAFRGTNVALFDRRKEEVKRFNGKEIQLDITYRTEPELLKSMGHLLEHLMADSELSGKDFYAAYEPMKTPDIPQNKKNPLPKEEPFIEVLIGKIDEKSDDPNHEIIGRLLAERLTELMNNGLLRSWSDAVILCRRADDFKQFEKALEAWAIPYVTVAGKGYYDRPEIRDILNILRAAENPDDNAVFTGFLLSPSIGFSAEMTALLYRYATKGGLKMSFRQAFSKEDFSFDDEEKQKILERARRILIDLIRISGQVPLDEVLEEAYRLTGIRTMLAYDSGDRAWLNLDKLLLTARESGLTSVSEFLEYLEEIKETGAREGEAPSDNNGAVRIMTIHQAKGLEFPVTIIAENESKSHYPKKAADSGGAPVFYSSPAHPRYKDAQNLSDIREKAEWLRLFYVAATRAEYRLILCGELPKMDGQKDTWLKRTLADIPDEMLQPGENIGSAWGIEGRTVRIRFSTKLPDIPSNPEIKIDPINTAEIDHQLLSPLPERETSPRNPEHTAALTVGKLVHKAMELWRFPDVETPDPLLDDAFLNILMQSDNLNSDEQQTVLKKAKMLLSRFRKSETYLLIDSAESRLSELPFSYPGRDYSVNGVIDMVIKNNNGYTIIDFKTDELNSQEDLTKAVNEHLKQIQKYRHALNVTLGIDPCCELCFLDYCGNVILQPIGKDALSLAEEEFNSDDWIPDEVEIDNYWFEEDINTSELPSMDF